MTLFVRRKRMLHGLDAKVRHFGIAAIGITGGILVMVMLALTQYLGVR